MISKVSLENFKGFKSLNNMKIKPVTVLCGTNSCGKTSLLQSILLMRQTLESQNPNQTLLLNGRFVNLGKFEDIIFEKDLDKEVTFEFSFGINKDSSNLIETYDSIFRGIITDKDIVESKVDLYANCKVSLKVLKEKKHEHHISSIIVDYFSFQIEKIKQNRETIPIGFIEIAHTKEETYSVNIKSLNTNKLLNEEDLNTDNLFGHFSFILKVVYTFFATEF